MKCPFELPVKVIVTETCQKQPCRWGIEDNAGHPIIYELLYRPDADYIVQVINSHEKKCKWSQCESAEEVYSTDCGRMFEFTHDGPQENHFTHCPYCGGILVNLVEQALEESEKEQ